MQLKSSSKCRFTALTFYFFKIGEDSFWWTAGEVVTVLLQVSFWFPFILQFFL